MSVLTAGCRYGNGWPPQLRSKISPKSKILLGALSSLYLTKLSHSSRRQLLKTMASSLGPTFLASLRAVGTAVTMMGAGFYLHRQNYVTPQGKTMLALIAQQVTIPAFLFAKIIYCPTDRGGGGGDGGGGDDAPEVVCPSVADRIGDLWMLCLWPFYVVASGLLVGYVAARISGTPPVQARSCLAACAFPNSTGLVITLLSVIHKQFSSSAELGKVDPTAFLSVYLLLYPVLQWGIGGWLLAPAEHAENEDYGRSMPDTIEIVNVQGPSMDRGGGKNGMTEASRLLPHQDSTNSQGLGNSFRISHILNYDAHHQSATAAAEQEIFGRVMATKRRNGVQDRRVGQDGRNTDGSALKSMVKELSFAGFGNLGGYEETQPDLTLLPDQKHLLPEPESFESIDGPPTMDAGNESISTFVELKGFASTSDISQSALTKHQIRAMQRADILPLTETLLRISHKIFQPPVTASLLGLFIASFHNLRGTFVNIYGDKGRQAPLQFLFDGIYSVSSCRGSIVRPCVRSNDLSFVMYILCAGWSIRSANQYDNIRNKSLVDLSEEIQKGRRCRYGAFQQNHDRCRCWENDSHACHRYTFNLVFGA